MHSPRIEDDEITIAKIVLQPTWCEQGSKIGERRLSRTAAEVEHWVGRRVVARGLQDRHRQLDRRTVRIRVVLADDERATVNSLPIHKASTQLERTRACLKARDRPLHGRIGAAPSSASRSEQPRPKTTTCRIGITCFLTAQRALPAIRGPVPPPGWALVNRQ